MNDKTVRNIYGIFVSLAGFILYFGSIYEVTQTMQISFLLAPAYIPLYIKIAIILLVIPTVIDMWGDMFIRNKNKRNKLIEKSEENVY